ncbi:MAG: NUDIX hydrolase [Patescibacteria group bacterium]
MITCVFEDGGKGKLRHVVADTIVLKDDKILMVKRSPNLLEGGKWGLIGGYAERDETIVGTVGREVMEETGWAVENITLLAIVDNPDRANEDRQNVVFVYFCDATKKVGEADDESEEVKWFVLDKLPSKEQIAFDHAEHIELYKQYLEGDVKLPIMSKG